MPVVQCPAAHLGLVPVVQQDVGRLDVPVDEGLGVGGGVQVLQPLSAAPGDPEPLHGGQGGLALLTTGQPLLEAPSLGTQLY